ncbi:diguanylate cyclase [Bremerella cremea]|uniref:diguanylate cyclase n=1 Tax=Bremerella cremea TaxID=1031537 RepID=UPI0031F0CB8C
MRGVSDSKSDTLTTIHSPQIEHKPAHGRVLVVDDDRLIRTLMHEYLSREGYEVVLAENCLEALSILEEASNEFKFLVTDWELPDGSGIDLIRHVRHVVCSHYMYIVMATSHGHRDNLTRALNAGADDFLAKPIDRGELIARMRAGQRILDLETRLTHLANSDLLTGLPTRRVFEELVSKEWGRARRYRRPLSCVLFDIDYFKRVNDIHGHAAGDQVLREVGRVFADSVRDSDIICRYGGEEFCALLPEATSEQAAIWAEKLRKRLSERDIILDSAVVNVTISMGIAESLAEMEDPEDLVEIADQCLLEAKGSGRNQVVCFNDLKQAAAESANRVDPIFGEAIAADAMTQVVSSVTPESSVIEVSQFFLTYRIPSAPVVNKDGLLVGVVSDKDLLAVASQPDPYSTTIDQVMRRNPICYPPDIPLRVVWEFLNRVSIRSLFISQNGKTLGIISRQSILRWLANSVWKKSAPVEGGGVGPVSTPQRIETAARLLADASRKLSDDVDQFSEDDHAAMVIGSVSQMQELLNELLASVGEGGGAMHLDSILESYEA